MSEAPERIWAGAAYGNEIGVDWSVRKAFENDVEYVRADTIAALEAENQRLREVIGQAARYADGIRGAVETNQVTDKDVRGVAILIRDNLRAALEGE
jgi:hypothetical protein